MLKEIWKDFIHFLKKHDALSLAVGVLIAKSVGQLTNSIVKDIFRPTIDPALDKLKDKLKLKKLVLEYGFVKINLGNFIDHLIEFLILGIAIVTIAEIS